MMLYDVCLSRTCGLSREQRGLGRLKLAEVAHVTRDSSLGHRYQCQKVKGQLVADVLNGQHAGTGATWRINAKILSTCRPGRGHIVPAFPHSLFKSVFIKRSCFKQSSFVTQTCLSSICVCCVTFYRTLACNACRARYCYINSQFLSVQCWYCIITNGHIVTPY